MKGKNLIYIVAIDSDKSQFKNSDYAQYSLLSWELWCKKNSVDLIVNREHDPRFTFPIWNKEKIYEIGKGYDKIGIVDSDTIISPNAPNIFDLFTEDDFCGVGDLCDINWLLSSIDGRQHFFPDTNLDISQYFNAGVLFLGSKHLTVFEDLLNLYLNNQDAIDGIKGGGKEQTLLNYVVQSSGVEVKLLDPSWNLLSMHRKNIIRNNWQLNIDPAPYFIKYAYIWHFTGFPIEHRTNFMRETWELVTNIKQWY
tara:strand:+ start:1958 stop:2716 length:759 start_codon:yes stop_codon:yes gene_type:complete